MKCRRILALAILSLLISASTAVAAETDWSLRFYGFYMETSDTPSVVTEAGTRAGTDNGYGAGGGVNAEYRFNPRLGLELGAWIADHGDFRAVASTPDLEVDVTDTMTISSASAGLNYHLAPGFQADVYVGVLLALMSYDDLTISQKPAGQPPEVLPASVRVGIDSDVAFGLNLGLDLGLGETDWILYANLRYLRTSMDLSFRGGSLGTVDYDPLLIGIGFGYRF